MSHSAVIAAFLFGYATFWFAVSLVRKRNDVADVAWGLGFVLLTWVSFFLAEGSGNRGLLVALLVSVWGIRLTWHIHSRNRGKTEDYRYAAWRQEWGKWFYPRSFLQVYLLQGFLCFLIAAPILAIHQDSATPLGWIDFLGVAVWIFGFVFEAVADAQLARFLKRPENRGKLMRSGLWAYSRHPNYFGEVVLWWGVWILSLSVPGGWIAVIGPLVITFLILKVSGIPMLERKMAENPEFREYARRVSAFVPLPPKRGS